MGLYAAWQDILQLHADSIAFYPSAGSPLRFADLQNLLNQLPTLPARSIHCPSTDQGQLPFILQTLRAWRDNAILCPLESASSTPTLPSADDLPNHICHLKHTSGSTGSPRCIMFTPAQLAADPANIRSTMGLNPRCPNLAVISLAHSYGFSNLVLPLLLQGHPLIEVSDVLPASLLRAITPFQNTSTHFTLPAVPAMWRAWFRAGTLHKIPLALAITAGAPMPIELEQAIYHEHHLKIHNFLGSSECGAIAYDQSCEPRTDPTYVGTAAHQVQLSVNTDGCLVVQSDAVAEGYHHASDQDHARLHHRQFSTSDLANLRNNDVFLLGRATDTINLAGRKLDPAELESLFLQHPDIHHCVVFGIPSRDAARCEETVVCINANKNLTQLDLAHWLNDRVPLWKRPRHYWFTDQLRPDARGKTSRPLWRSRWQETQPHTFLKNP